MTKEQCLFHCHTGTIYAISIFSFIKQFKEFVGDEGPAWKVPHHIIPVPSTRVTSSHHLTSSQYLPLELPSQRTTRCLTVISSGMFAYRLALPVFTNSQQPPRDACVSIYQCRIGKTRRLNNRLLFGKTRRERWQAGIRRGKKYRSRKPLASSHSIIRTTMI